ncbi:peroxide stress protein YaaA [Microbacterium trichothecenolyticum]|uniref:Peroxide stress protein YaaA n=1 Tax=Microbacterium ureisolvens TaxID=2781186 RepID=A0ABS7HX67_9MICO|nr:MULTISPECIES: peroxide stress protein YaaA [Microbacterium]MBW9109971.1 peroxide stress protein YaaA [Microbacterium ureisolvens]MBW9119270.1 peroxide stress protein YaaA [Microbacterium trichothecenolyticum]
MLILLPPSETKRSGGTGAPLDVTRLALPQLASQREAVVAALVALSGDEDHAARVLKLGPKQRDEVAVNAALREGPSMPAIDRYTGVLFDALDAASLSAAARRWLGAHVMVHSAPFGPVGALDRIPAYRLGAATSLPGVPPLRRLWGTEVTAALAALEPRFVLDLRSEAYVGLGPVPADVRSRYVRVVSEGADGAVRALNHFNKHAKGALVRRLAEDRPRIGSAAAFLTWADAAGLRVRETGAGELELFA